MAKLPLDSIATQVEDIAHDLTNTTVNGSVYAWDRIADAVTVIARAVSAEIPEKRYSTKKAYIADVLKAIADVDLVNTQIEPLTVTENDTYSAGSGKAYNPVTVNVPSPTLRTLYVSENGIYRAESGEGYGEVDVSVDACANVTVKGNFTKSSGTLVTDIVPDTSKPIDLTLLVTGGNYISSEVTATKEGIRNVTIKYDSGSNTLQTVAGAFAGMDDLQEVRILSPITLVNNTFEDSTVETVYVCNDTVIASNAFYGVSASAEIRLEALENVVPGVPWGAPSGVTILYGQIMPE